jgi:hypothetical protein
MKARSKAAKVRARKGGRPRKVGVDREPSGRIAKGSESEKVMKTAVDARMRLFGITYEAARSQEGGTTVGRMYLAKEITIDQYRAAERYTEVKNAFQRAIGAVPDAGVPPPPPEFERGVGDFESFCKQAKLIWSGDERAGIVGVVGVLRNVMVENRSPNALSAIDVFITKDAYVPSLVGDLRLALNALHRHFTMERRRAA